MLYTKTFCFIWQAKSYFTSQTLKKHRNECWFSNFDIFHWKLKIDKKNKLHILVLWWCYIHPAANAYIYIYIYIYIIYIYIYLYIYIYNIPKDIGLYIYIHVYIYIYIYIYIYREREIEIRIEYIRNLITDYLTKRCKRWLVEPTNMMSHTAFRLAYLHLTHSKIQVQGHAHLYCTYISPKWWQIGKTLLKAKIWK